jgi:hypothetical protein
MTSVWRISDNFIYMWLLSKGLHCPFIVRFKTNSRSYWFYHQAFDDNRVFQWRVLYIIQTMYLLSTVLFVTILITVNGYWTSYWKCWFVMEHRDSRPDWFRGFIRRIDATSEPSSSLLETEDYDMQDCRLRSASLKLCYVELSVQLLATLRRDSFSLLSSSFLRWVLSSTAAMSSAVWVWFRLRLRNGAWRGCKGISWELFPTIVGWQHPNSKTRWGNWGGTFDDDEQNCPWWSSTFPMFGDVIDGGFPMGRSGTFKVSRDPTAHRFFPTEDLGAFPKVSPRGDSLLLPWPRALSAQIVTSAPSRIKRWWA